MAARACLVPSWGCGVVGELDGLPSSAGRRGRQREMTGARGRKVLYGVLYVVSAAVRPSATTPPSLTPGYLAIA